MALALWNANAIWRDSQRIRIFGVTVTRPSE
ncbi:hypothetical protein BH11GEM1_BH11GEM1_34790 [soil metagenome]